MFHDKSIRADPSTLPKTPASKREKIRKMLSAAENYDAKEIAKSADTTQANVYKEKSKLKAEGLMLRSQRRNLQVSERKDEIIIIPEDGRRRPSSDSYNYSPHYRFINVRELDEEGLKTLYTELKNGKKPAEIIARYGFHPEVVEMEYQRFLRLNERSIIGAFQKEIIPQLRCAVNRDQVDKFEKEGYLSANEFKELMDLRLNQDELIRKQIDRYRELGKHYSQIGKPIRPENQT